MISQGEMRREGAGRGREGEEGRREGRRKGKEGGENKERGGRERESRRGREIVRKVKGSRAVIRRPGIQKH